MRAAESALKCQGNAHAQVGASQNRPISGRLRVALAFAASST